MTELPQIHIDPKTFLYEHCSLPALPEVVSRIQEVIYSKNVTIDKITKIISTDPALVAQVLKIVNSAYYGLPLEIVDIKFAITILGINEIHRIALTVSVLKSLKNSKPEAYKELWFHSLFTAVIVKYLTKKFEPISVDELWIAALLHDIGKFVYLKFFPEHYMELRTYKIKHKCFLTDAEKHYSFPSSSTMGELLCDRWRLPKRIRDACSKHSIEYLKNKENDPDEIFLEMITIANLLAMFTTDKLSGDKQAAITEVIQTNYNLDDSDFLELIDDVLGLKKRVNVIMSQINLFSTK